MRCSPVAAIDLPDRGATLFRRHAVVGDVAVRPDGHVQARAVPARDHVLGPVGIDRACGQLDHSLARLVDPRLTFLVRKTQQSIGVGDIKVAAHQRHPERRMQPLDEHGPRLHDAIAVGIAQQRDAIGARCGRAGPLHEELHRPAPDAATAGVGAGWRIGLGHQHVAVRQNIDPARMVQPVGERGDGQARRRDRRRALRPAYGRSDVHGRDEGLVGRRQHGVRADARRYRELCLLAASAQGERRRDEHQQGSEGLVHGPACKAGELAGTAGPPPLSAPRRLARSRSARRPAASCGRGAS